MKLQTILNRLQKLHPKEIDLSLDRVKILCKKLGNPQNKLKYISVVGTNGKYSTIQAVRSILKTEISLILSILLKKDNAVNEKQINETSDNIEPLAKAAS